MEEYNAPKLWSAPVGANIGNAPTYSALEVLRRDALYKATFYLLTYLPEIEHELVRQ